MNPQGVRYDPYWVPGDPLYDQGRSTTAFMISIKRDREDLEVNPDAARWSPQVGWCYVGYRQGGLPRPVGP